MSVTYRIAKNYTLHVALVILVASAVGLVIFFVPGALPDSARPILGTLGLWIPILGGLGALIGGWYVAEQLWKRRKFEKLLKTDKRSDFVASRKDLEDLAKALPDRYKPRIAEKEAQFSKSRRA
jgi:hypothetical protein